MDAAPFETPLPKPLFLFDIYHDGQPARNKPGLPIGPCNFVDLTAGANGARCGCRRFWGRGTSGVHLDNADPSQAVWCMCSHHACFHDEVQPGQTLNLGGHVMAPAGQENERPEMAREPLGPVHQDLSGALRLSPGIGQSVEFPNLISAASFMSHKADEPYPQVDVVNNGRNEASIPDTMSWANFGRSQNGNNTLPPIPQQCLLPSQPPSTASSSQMRYLRPFAGKGLQTLSGVSRTRGLPTQQDVIFHGLDEAIAQDLADGGHGPVDAQSEATCPDDARHCLMPQVPPGQSLVAPDRMSHEAYKQLSGLLQGHEQRLDRLENTSFSVTGHEECHDKHEHADLRVTELESRVEEVERRLNDDNSTIISGGRVLRDDDATNSIVSVAPDASSHALGRSELYSQLQALQARVDQLQTSSFPTYASPWELEVVFLPFALEGIWMEAHDFSAQTQAGRSGRAIDEWTQLPNTHSRATPDPQSQFFPDWIAQAATDSDWLLPRACAPGRMIDKRLRSRGLIKTIQVKGPDARSVQTAMNTAFSDIMRIMPIKSRPNPSLSRSNMDPRPMNFLGLQQLWVPLRKIHKDSRLRLLSPAEMLTPALWDVSFLASIAMKATGNQRLYVTQPEAYLQDWRASSPSAELAWTWQKIRELPRVYQNSQSSIDAEVPEADAMEECWAWTDRLDAQSTSQRSSAGLHQARQPVNKSHSTTVSSSQYYTAVQLPDVLTSPVAVRAQSPFVAISRQGSRPPHVRPTSMPPSLPNAPPPAGSGKRRVVSSSSSRPIAQGVDRRTPSFAGRPSPGLRISTATSAMAITKRRRGTRSPSLHPRNTPRWSNMSMSRSPSLGPLGPPGRIEDGRGERRTTPLYYATPYSNGPPEYHNHARHSSRGPVAPSSNYGYGGLDDDDMGYDDNRGSSTDPDDDYDMAYLGEQGYQQVHHDTDVDIDVYEDEPDELDGLDSPDSADNEQDDSEWHGVGLHARRPPDHSHQQLQLQSAQQLPEDEPWPGIEEHTMSDDENINPLSVEAEAVDIELQDRQHGNGDDDGRSDVSSQPSEYPSTQRAWHIPANAGDNGQGGMVGVGNRGSSASRDGDDVSSRGLAFKIHEDEEDEEDGAVGNNRLVAQWP